MRITLWPEKNSWFRRNTTLVLCVLTMFMLTLGISEQGATIAQQKGLILVLAQDSQMLMAMRAQQAQQANEAQQKADTQVAPNEKTGNTAEQQAQSQTDEEQSKDSAASARKRQQTPKADAVIDLREARRVLLKS
jgi:hypothetical protein